ncbi:MAG: metallophosphatase family protein [Spirochaetia bacterium]|nr:metallophosphatase family protein [Spirochaetia bacterium]
MRIAAIYDLHANTVALEAVLRDIHKENIEMLVVGGDVVSGPNPSETLRILCNISIPVRFILGNAESDILNHLAGKEFNGLSPRANEEAIWVASVLSDDEKKFLSSWGFSYSVESDIFGKILFCHGTPRSNQEIFTKQTSDEELKSIFKDVSASLVVCGHTHMQFDIMTGDIRVVNAGSLGMPFGFTGADWILIDEAIEFKHTDYNLESAAETIRNSNYPHAQTFSENHVLNVPSEDIMLNTLTKSGDNQRENKLV